MDKDTVILVVDDEREHADGIAEAMEKLCGRAIAVYNGADALEIVRNEKVDVIVTDLKLGGDIDGLAILGEVKKQQVQTEVILITAYATIDTCKEAIRCGAYDYLVKPIDIDRLRAVVEQACRRSSRGDGQKRRRPSEKGQFVFEGIRGNWNSEQKQLYLFRLKEHYQRMHEGCQVLKIDLPYTVGKLCQITVELVEKCGVE